MLLPFMIDGKMTIVESLIITSMSIVCNHCTNIVPLLSSTASGMHTSHLMSSFGIYNESGVMSHIC